MNGSEAKEYARALRFFSAERPAPTGPFAVGLRDIVLSAGPLGNTTVSLWYPTDVARPGLLGRVWLRLLHPTSADFVPDAPWSGARPTFPLIIHFPSWFNQRNETSFSLAELASQGFAVAAVDDIVNLKKVGGAAGEAQAAGFDNTSPEDFQVSRVLAAQRAQMEANFGRSVIDALLSQPSVGSHLDASDVGVVGFSFGGAAALELSLIDPRIKAVVNLDGLVLGKAETTQVKAPYLFLSADIQPPTLEELRQPDLAVRFDRMMDGEVLKYQERQAALPDNFTVFIKGTTHTDFTDRLLIPGFWDTDRPRQFDRVETWRSITSRLSWFFDKYLGESHRDATALGENAARPAAGALP